MIAYAAQSIPLLDNIVREIIQPIILLLAAVAFVYFLYGVYEMIKDSSSDTAREKGKQHIIWGVIGLFIMFSAIGIINVVCKTIGVC